jgi:hypothetical protein
MRSYSFVEECLSWRDKSLSEVQQSLSISEAQIERNANYMKLTNLMELHNPDVHPGYFYFRNGKFALLYVGGGEELEQLDPKALQNRFGGEGVELRSRAGKHFNHHVYPEVGLAFSTDGEVVSILEVFPPTSLAEYQSSIYQEPPVYYK